MKINGNRLIKDLKTLCMITDTPGEGVTRFSYGDKDIEVRKYIIDQSIKYGFHVQCDEVGNMLIKPKKSKGRTWIGSHIDTVRNGGWLDGIYGVISALEILRTLSENDRDHDIGLIIFAEEEGSNFGSTMTGSKFMTGHYSEKDMYTLKTDNGITMREVLSESCLLLEGTEVASIDPSKSELMIELHIEQGPVLDDEQLELGIVDIIFGMKTVEVTFEGMGNHAGASPMNRRKDALTAAAEAVLETEKTAEADADGRTVATVGKFKVFPDCSNVVPERVVFTVEVRDSDNDKIRKTMDKIKRAVIKIGKKRGVTCTIRDLASSRAIPLSSDIVAAMERKAAAKGLKYKVMNSGAVHDTAMITEKTAGAMIFVPSINGRSHVPEENTNERDLIGGAQFLMDFLEG